MRDCEEAYEADRGDGVGEHDEGPARLALVRQSSGCEGGDEAQSVRWHCK